MRNLSIILFLTLVFAGSTLGQTFSETVAKVRQIRLLQSTRQDVKRVLREYDTTDDDDHYQEFSKGGLTIEIFYSSGTCAADPDEEDASEDWNVKEWTVTQIEISPSEPITLRSAGLNLATFKKEQRYRSDPDSFVHHDKVAGIAVKTSEEEIENLIFFPPKASRNMLCRTSTAAKGFYTRKGWFSLARPYDYICELINLIPNVTELNLSAIEIDRSAETTISVNTVATDAENDVLTYTYKVSAGQIIGNGTNVEWDLSGVQPGTYTIFVGVNDGAGVVGKTVTKTVVVK